MASQRLIIAKIGGRAAEITRERFEHWASKRTSDDPSEWDSGQWPEGIRIEADRWFDDLRQYSTAPPILFYAEYNDYWSSFPPSRFVGTIDRECLTVFGNRYEGFCTTLPLKTFVVDRLRQARRQPQNAEDETFAWLTLHAAREWCELVEGGVLVFVREVYGGLVEDREITESLTTEPKWMLSK